MACIRDLKNQKKAHIYILVWTLSHSNTAQIIKYTVIIIVRYNINIKYTFLHLTRMLGHNLPHNGRTNSYRLLCRFKHMQQNVHSRYFMRICTHISTRSLKTSGISYSLSKCNSLIDYWMQISEQQTNDSTFLLIPVQNPQFVQ